MSNSEQTLGAVLTRLYSVIESRKGAAPETSYTASLLSAGPARCAKKFGEEAVETVIAATQGARSDIKAEAADALYHLLVLLAATDVTPSDVAAVLSEREGISGHDEKASR